VASRLPLLAFAVTLLLLPGCTGGGAATLSDTVTGASGSRTTSTSCDGSGVVTVSVSGGTAGSVRFTVTDGTSAQVFDSGAMSGTSSSTDSHVSGEKGKWTLTAQRAAFSGTYSATLSC
jgi:hypothetical protein